MVGVGRHSGPRPLDHRLKRMSNIGPVRSLLHSPDANTGQAQVNLKCDSEIFALVNFAAGDHGPAPALAAAMPHARN